MKNALLSLFLVLPLSLCHAAGAKGVSPGRTQAGMNQDANAEFTKVEAEMTVLYQKIIDRYSSGPKANPSLVKKLRAAQRAWISFRDAHIESVYPSDGPHFSAGPMCVILLRTELTRARIAQLNEWWVGIEEGDVCAGSRATRQ